MPSTAEVSWSEGDCCFPPALSTTARWRGTPAISRAGFERAGSSTGFCVLVKVVVMNVRLLESVRLSSAAGVPPLLLFAARRIDERLKLIQILLERLAAKRAELDCRGAPPPRAGLDAL